MARPCFIIAEPEPEQALSVRKLVIETAKFNVITAHSAVETMESIELFPNVNAIILHSSLNGSTPVGLIKQARARAPKTPIITLSPSAQPMRGADYAASSHDPQELVNLLRELFGDPRKEP